jgi:hypothetical protein
LCQSLTSDHAVGQFRRLLSVVVKCRGNDGLRAARRNSQRCNYMTPASNTIGPPKTEWSPVMATRLAAT